MLQGPGSGTKGRWKKVLGLCFPHLLVLYNEDQVGDGVESTETMGTRLDHRPVKGEPESSQHHGRGEGESYRLGSETG